MCTGVKNLPNASSVNVTDEGRALPDGWYVAYTRVNYERRGAQYISRLGCQTYIAIQKEWRQWSDRRKLMDRVVIPQIIFVKCDHKTIDKLSRLSFIAYFMRIPGSTKLATVPDAELANLQTALSQSESSVIFTTEHFKLGDPVRIRFGKLAGMTGNITKLKDGSTSLIVTLDYLGCAVIKIEAEDLQPI